MIATKNGAVTSSDCERLTLDELTALVHKEYQLADRIGKRTTRHVWRAGRYLYQVRRLLQPRGEWERWLRDQHLAKTTVWQDITLYEYYGSEEAASKFPITEAKKRAGAVKPPGAPKRTQGEKRDRPDARRVPRDATKAAQAAVHALLHAARAVHEHRAQTAWRKAGSYLKWQEAFKLVSVVDQEYEVDIYSYYSTPPEAVVFLLDKLQEHGISMDGDIWEPCCAQGVVSQVLESRGYTVHSSDLRDRPEIYGKRGVDVFGINECANVVTNPPHKNALAVGEHLIRHATGKVALLLRVEMLGAMSRRPFWEEHPPAYFLPLHSRPHFRRGGKEITNTQWDYGWYLWDTKHTGPTLILN